MIETFTDRPRTPEKLTMESTLAEIDSFLMEIYNRRDSIYLSGRSQRIGLLHASIDDLSVATRKETDNQKFKEALVARIVSRIFCIARSVDGVSIAEGLSEKFPRGGCSYCGQMPCECRDKDRSPYTLSEPSLDQIHWTLKEWQDHLTQMYGDKNVEKGIDFVINRLSSEHRELASLEDQIEHPRKPIEIETAIREFQLELTDTLAWTIGAASVIGVDMQAAVVARYGEGCSVCREKPCRCPQGAHNLQAFNGKGYDSVAAGDPF